MKLSLKKTLSVLCALLLLFTNSIVFAKKSSEPLYEIYPYAENFEYSDEILPHALKAAVPKIYLVVKATLYHSSVTFDKAQLNEDLDYIYSEYSLIPDDELNSLILKYLHDNVTSYIRFGSKQRIDVESAFEGSGVVVSEDGYIATNAHVVDVDEESKKELYAYEISESVVDDLSDIFEYLEGFGVTFTDSEKESLFYQVLGAVASETEVLDEETSVEVFFPNAKGDTNPESAISYTAEVLEVGNAENVTVDGLTQDNAIIKIDAENLVALKLSESYPELNSSLVSAGYPVASDSVFRSLGSNEATLSITIGNGTVSRHVPIADAKYQAIEVNLTISGGNSGGPSVDKHLDIEGLNTYINAQDNRYAYMVPAEFVATLLEPYSPSQDETTKTFLLGLQMLQQGYGATAVECFERVRELNPDIPYIEKVIEIAKNAPDEKYPVSGSFNIPISVIIAICAAVVLILVVVIILVLVSNSKKKKAVAVGSIPPHTPYSAPTPPPRPAYTPPAPHPHSTPSAAPVVPRTNPIDAQPVIPKTPTPTISHTDTTRTVMAPSSGDAPMHTPPASAPPKPRSGFFQKPDDLL